MKLEFGKYRGWDLNNVPDGYLQWVYTRNVLLLVQIREEMEKRGKKLTLIADGGAKSVIPHPRHNPNS